MLETQKLIHNCQISIIREGQLCIHASRAVYCAEGMCRIVMNVITGWREDENDYLIISLSSAAENALHVLFINIEENDNSGHTLQASSD